MLSFYLMVFLRRLPLFLLVVVAVAGAGIYLAATLPTVYRADAKLLVEDAQIPTELAASTVQVGASEQLEIMQQRLLTRNNLIDIATEFDVFPNRTSMSPDTVVSEMRRQTVFDRGGGRDGATIVTIRFEARTGAIAAAVVNEYVTRILQANAELRRGRAGDTLAFFKQQVDRLNRELDIQSQRIVDFQRENAGALPEGLDYRLNRVSLLQERLAQNAREIAQLEAQKQRMTELFETTGRLGPQQEENRTPEERELDNLEQQMSEQLLVYSETNPRIVRLRARIDQMRGIVANQTGADPDAPDQGSIFDLQIAEIDSQILYSEDRTDQIQAELDALTGANASTASNRIAINALNRDYSNVQSQYNQAISALSDAATGEQIELLSKGQRISVVEQATAPNSPSSPNRPMIALGGVAAALASGFGLVFLLEVLNTAIRRPDDITARLGITPLAVIPRIETAAEIWRRRLTKLIVAGAASTTVAAAVYYVHMNVQPLDLLVRDVADRIFS